MKQVVVKALMLGVMTIPLLSHAADGDLLTGDTKLACEATLCLSTGDRPGECAPSIKKYFSISAKKMSDTIKKRKNFLSLCPASKEEGMPALINALANGAGRCDAAELNRMARKTYQVQQCTGKGKNKTCTMVTKNYIANTKPSYCSAYFNHEWTVTGDSVKYIGDEKNGGKWVDVK